MLSPFQTYCLLIILNITMGLQLHVLISFIHNRLVLIGASFMFHETVTTVCVWVWCGKWAADCINPSANKGKELLCACNASDCCQITRTICIPSREWTVFPIFMNSSQSHHVVEPYLPMRRVTGSMLFRFKLSWASGQMIAAQRVTEGQNSLQLSPTHKTNHIRSTLRSKTRDKR